MGNFVKSAAGFVARLLFVAACISTALPVMAFELQGHRGARGLLPENTLAGFERALEIGVTTLELDIAITADGVPVISHDPELSPALTRDAQGQWIKTKGPLIRTLSLAQLQTYDVGRIDPASEYARQFKNQQPRDGQRLPTLAALFARVNELGADRVQFAIETKIFPDRPQDTLGPQEFVDALLAVIRQARMVERVRIISFDWRTLQLVQKLEPAIETVYVTMEFARNNTVRDAAWTGGIAWAEHASVAHMIKASGGRFWSPHFNHIDAAKVKAAQQLGVKVLPWTVNEPADMDRLIGWGVDGIVTDYPDRLRESMQRAGLVLPAPVPA